MSATIPINFVTHLLDNPQNYSRSQTINPNDSPLLNSHHPSPLPNRERRGIEIVRLTQLLAQFASNALPSVAHSFPALPSSLIASAISCLSRHWKYISRASQHFERSVRFGAMGVPSVESLGPVD